jgi:putative oxidoreductase
MVPPTNQPVPTSPHPARAARRTWRAITTAVVRILVGLFYLTAGLPKLTAHSTWVGQFHHWHVPLPGLAVYAVGSFEVIGGTLLAIGVLPRLIAALFTIDMFGAILFAGLTDGARQIILPGALGVITLLFASTGAGAWQLYPVRRNTAHPR